MKSASAVQEPKKGVLSRLPAPEQPSESSVGEYEEQLLGLRKLLSEDVSSLERGQDDGSTEPSGALTHLADRGTDAAARDVTLQRLGSSVDVLREIDDALARIGDGSFGSCEDCGRRIPESRLRAIPYARLCVPCKMESDESP